MATANGATARTARKGIDVAVIIDAATVAVGTNTTVLSGSFDYALSAAVDELLTSAAKKVSNR